MADPHNSEYKQRVQFADGVRIDGWRESGPVLSQLPTDLHPTKLHLTKPRPKEAVPKKRPKNGPSLFKLLVAFEFMTRQGGPPRSQQMPASVDFERRVHGLQRALAAVTDVAVGLG